MPFTVADYMSQASISKSYNKAEKQEKSALQFWKMVSSKVKSM